MRVSVRACVRVRERGGEKVCVCECVRACASARVHEQVCVCLSTFHA